MNAKNRRLGKRIAGFVSALLACNLAISAQEESASPAPEKKSYPEVPKEYEVGEDTISPDGRFAILYEVRDENSNIDPGLSNLLVRLKPYAELAEIENYQGVTWKDGRGAPEAKWNANSTFVAIWHAMKWGHEDLAVYEIENDKVKRVQKIWPEIVKYFARDGERLLKKYPKEFDGYTFVSDSRVKELEFKDHKLLLDIFAQDKPNLPGPHWTAELRGVWNLDTGKFDKVDFRPGKLEVWPSVDQEQ
jgi:hypothetical protein